MCVDQRQWIDAKAFEDAISTVNLLPGPASTQLAIYCAWHLRRKVGAIVGGVCFIVPGLVLILVLSVLFLARHPSTWIVAIAEGAGAAVPAVALHAAKGLAPSSWNRIGGDLEQRARWSIYAALGALCAIFLGPYLVFVLVLCGVVEILVRRRQYGLHSSISALGGVAGVHVGAIGGLLALVWVALKVGALSYGGGFVIVPLMQHDAVSTYHWMSGSQFLNAVALGQITPGPVVLTTAVIGYAARGFYGGLLAVFIAFTPSFLFVMLGGPRFQEIRANRSIESFLTGSGPAVIGAIAGSSVPLGMTFRHPWQVGVFVVALGWLFVARRGVVSGFAVAASIGVLMALIGVSVS